MRLLKPLSTVLSTQLRKRQLIEDLFEDHTRYDVVLVSRRFEAKKYFVRCKLIPTTIYYSDCLFYDIFFQPVDEIPARAVDQMSASGVAVR